MNKKELRILLAEDEPNLQFLVVHQLNALGYGQPDIAENGLVAVEKTSKTKYDIVLMDVMMPDLDGLAASERIRRNEASSGFRTVIVGMTAFALKERCLSVGMDDFLQKPVLLEQMEAMLEQWLKADPDSKSQLNQASCST